MYFNVGFRVELQRKNKNSTQYMYLNRRIHVLLEGGCLWRCSGGVARPAGRAASECKSLSITLTLKLCNSRCLYSYAPKSHEKKILGLAL